MADVTLSPLHRADGSATFTSNGYSVVAAVNGPIEVQRRDELPEEAAIDVAIRPAAGVGGKDRCYSDHEPSSMLLMFVTGVRERHLESILQSTLRNVILVSAHPRTLIQVTLQIISSKEESFNAGDLPQATSVRPVVAIWCELLRNRAESPHPSCPPPSHYPCTSVHIHPPIDDIDSHFGGRGWPKLEVGS